MWTVSSLGLSSPGPGQVPPHPTGWDKDSGGDLKLKTKVRGNEHLLQVQNNSHLDAPIQTVTQVVSRLGGEGKGHI